MHIFEGFLGGIVTATLAIIITEIVFDYGLGDFLKDFFLSLFGQAKSIAEARLNRLRAKAAQLAGKLGRL